MTSKIKVDNIADQDDNNIINESGDVITVGAAGDTVAVAGNIVKSNAYQASDGGNIVSQSGTTVTLGASGDTITLASGASQSGFGRTGTVDWETTKKTASFTATNGEGYFVDTSSSALTVTLPASPSAGNIVAINDYAGTSATNNITINRNSSNIEGLAQNGIINVDNASKTLVYVDGTQGWKVVNDATTRATQVYEAQYFVLAGGGGGGYAYTDFGSGAGGGGGFRNSYDSPLKAPAGLTVANGASYPITVGAGGGPGPSSPGYVGVSGSPSIFSTITSTGGGGGAGNSSPFPGGPGGSGGGGAYGNTVAGTGNTPPVSPPQGNDGGTGQGSSGRGQGGGGAGGAAPPAQGSGPGGANDGGNGGAGLATSISGSPTTKAAGGKGGSYANNPGGTGSEPANSGNGGGGTGDSRGAANGGSGIVVIRYTTADAPPGTSGGSKSTCGSDTIHVFTGPGTFSA